MNESFKSVLKLSRIGPLLLVFTLLTHHLSFAQCTYLNDDITISASDFETATGYVQAYVLTDLAGNVIEISTSGTFSTVPMPGQYNLWGVNYDGADPITAAGIAAATTAADLAALVAGPECVDVAGPFTADICDAATYSTTICEEEANITILQAVPGTYNATPDYTQEYYLIDAVGNIIASSPNAVFPNPGLGSYTVYALNYDNTDAISTGAIAGAVTAADLQAIAGDDGAYCVDIAGPETVEVENCCIQVPCFAETISFAPAVGFETDPDYTQEYYLVDPAGNIVASSPTNSFPAPPPTVTGGTYNIWSFNYDNSDGATPAAVAAAVTDADLAAIAADAALCADLQGPLCATLPPTLEVCNDAGTFDVPPATGFSMDPGYVQAYVLTDEAGNIIEVSPTGTFMVPDICPSNYLAYAINYNSLDVDTDAAVNGATTLAELQGAGCIDIQGPLCVPVILCNCLLDYTMVVTQGQNGGTLPFYANTADITLVDGCPPYDYNWDAIGYVRNAVINSTQLSVDYADNASWAVTVTDAEGCEIIITNDPAGPGDPGALLDIYDHAITGDNYVLSSTYEGEIEIFVEGGTPGYTYEWEGPATWNGCGQGTALVCEAPYGWYTVTVTDANGDTTIGWFWVPKEVGSGRGKGELVEGITAYPNPFGTETTIEFVVKDAGNYRLAVYDLTGRLVKTLFEGSLEDNTLSTAQFKADDLPNALYIVQIEGATGIIAKEKVSLMRR